MSQKQCSRCKETKDFDEFYINRNKPSSMCKICTKANNKRYFAIPKNKRKQRERFWKKAGIKNMTYERYEEMLIQQDHCCKICGTHKDGLTRELAVDHNHETGEVRGLLCGQCNYFLGIVSNNVDIFTKSLYYLKETTENVNFQNSSPAHIIYDSI